MLNQLTKTQIIQRKYSKATMVNLLFFIPFFPLNTTKLTRTEPEKRGVGIIPQSQRAWTQLQLKTTRQKANKPKHFKQQSLLKGTLQARVTFKRTSFRPDKDWV